MNCSHAGVSRRLQNIDVNVVQNLEEPLAAFHSMHEDETLPPRSRRTRERLDYKLMHTSGSKQRKL